MFRFVYLDDVLDITFLLRIHQDYFSNKDVRHACLHHLMLLTHSVQRIVTEQWTIELGRHALIFVYKGEGILKVVGNVYFIDDRILT